ncbi:MAG: hypothetical protein EOM37_16570, partial [Proteobacteria bacterium]|nr:hypothetical protein [Pseudomonadota bacterium]
GLIEIITRYAQTFLLLQRYDEGLLTEPVQLPGGTLPTLNTARALVAVGTRPNAVSCRNSIRWTRS